jgi:hypothetical protein
LKTKIFSSILKNALAYYNAGVLNFYYATGSQARVENKNIFFYFEKCNSLLQRWRCSYNSKVVGLAPDRTKFRRLGDIFWR